MILVIQILLNRIKLLNLAFANTLIYKLEISLIWTVELNICLLHLVF